MMRRSEQEILDTVYKRSGQIRMRRRMLAAFAGVVAAAFVLTAAPTLVRQLAVQQLNTADQPKTEEGSGSEAANGGVQTTEGGPLGSGTGRPASGPSRGRQGTSGGKGSPSTATLPEGTISKSFEIAFTGSGIHLIQADGSNLRTLGPGADPGWTRDGKLIALISDFDGGDIQVMNSDGSGLQNLGVRGFSPTWSPNAGQLVFGRDCHAQQSGETCSAERTSWPSDPAEDCGPECGIGLVGRDGTGVGHLGNGLWPEWGPDGRILFADGVAAGPCYYDQGNAWTRGVYWGEEHQAQTLPPCELPIWVMNHDGSGRTRLPIDKAIRPTWSHDGRRIAYQTAADGVFIANSDGTGIRKVAPDGYTQPSWSPDGLWLALKGFTPPGGDYQGAGNIYLRSIDGSAERRLTSGALPAFSPRL